MSRSAEPYETTVFGYVVTVDDGQGHLIVQHGGDISWDELFAIKNELWGTEARAIEVYPAQSMLINNTNARHLWRLGTNDFCPDLLGRAEEHDDTLAVRHARAWSEVA